MKTIVWLASYPKSGSTWFRAILANLKRDASEPASINRLGAPIAGSRRWFDYSAGIESADLTNAEIDLLRASVHHGAANTSPETDPHFIKIHDTFLSPAGDPLISVDATRGVVYIVRNPLDVAVSYAHHLSCDVDKSIAQMADDRHMLVDRTAGLAGQLRQRLSSWGAHVRSWLDNGIVPVHVLRYEDLHASPADTTADALAFAGMRRERADIERAVRWSEIERLRAQEIEQGFSEKPASLPSFFPRGIAGAWIDELTPEQVARIVADHEPTMRRLGYLSGD